MDKSHQSIAYRAVCFTELCERFSFFGLRALLVLCIVHYLHWTDAAAYELFGAFCMLIYILPIFGGILTDQYLGYKKAILLGSGLICLGHLSLALFSNTNIYLGLALLSVGTGLILPGLMNIVGVIYKDDRVHQQSAYNYFYIWINIGGILAGCAIGFIADLYGWKLAFSFTAISMLIGAIAFYRYWPTIMGFVEKPPKKLSNTVLMLLLGTTILVVYYLLKLHAFANLFVLLATVFGIVLYSRIYLSSNTENRRNLKKILFLFTLSLIFFVIYEQSGASLMLFADRVIDRHLFGYLIPTSVTTSLNPLLIIFLIPLMGLLWKWLSQKNLEPQVWVKMCLGLITMSSGLLILSLGGSAEHPVIWFLFGGIAFMSIGEIFIGPVILAAISRYSPKEHANTLMGLWWLTDAIASYIASQLAKFTTISDSAVSTNLQYSTFFLALGLVGLCLGISPLILSCLRSVFKSSENTISFKDALVE